MVDVALALFQPEAVNPLVVADGAQGQQGHGLCLPPRKEGGPVGAGRDADCARNLPDLLGGAAVGAAFVPDDAAPDHVLLDAL